MVPAIEMSSQTASSIHDAKQTEEDSDNNMHKLAATAKKLSFEEQENVEQSELTKQKISNLVKSVPAVNAIFDIKDVIGEGTFSSVFLAHAKLKEDKKYALKYLVPTCHPNRILNELKCLKELGDKNNIIGVDLCLRNKDSIVFVMPYFTHDSFSSYIMNMDVDEIRQYMKNLLIALSAIHSSGIMHRDVKPSNFLYCRKQRRYALVDFGLAQRVNDISMSTQFRHSTPQFVKLQDLDKSQGIIGNRISISKVCNKDNGQLGKESLNKKRSRENQENDDGSRKRKLSSLSDNRSVLTKGILQSNPHRTNIQIISSNNPFKSSHCLSPSLNQVNKLDSSLKSDQVVDEKTTPHNRTGVKSSSSPKSCHCYGRAMICSVCSKRKSEVAPRAGTPGFRPPEVLLKSPVQTTGVDMWSSGVILLCILSKRYPFFKSTDDVTALAEIITVLGSQKVKTAASTYCKHILCEPIDHPGTDLKLTCQRLESCGFELRQIPDSAYDLLKRLMDANPATRITAEQALSHPFVRQ